MTMQAAQKKESFSLGRALNGLLLALISITCLIPFLHLLAKSFSSSTAVVSGQVGILPIGFQLKTYEYVFQDKLFLSSFRNSLFITVVGTALALAITTMAAYPLSKKDFRGRRVILLLYVFTMLFYGGTVSIYVFMSTLNLLNTLWCQIIPLVVSQYNLFVMKAFFEELPESIEEAACIDGASQFRTLISIILPLSLPSIATIGLFYAVGYWNGYYHAMLFVTRADVKPLQMYLYDLLNTASNIQELDPAVAVNLSQNGVQAACITVGTLPILMAYPFAQKYFVKGFTVGSVKG